MIFNKVRRYQVCEKWPLVIREDRIMEAVYADNQARKSLGKRSYFHWLVTNRFREMSQEALCYESLLSVLTPTEYESVEEWCGGLGMCSTIISELLSPEYHAIFEIDLNTTQHLRDLFPFRYKIRNSTALKTLRKRQPVDLVAVDFNHATLKTIVDDPDDYFHRALKHATRAVLWTDAAISKLHLNNNVYERLAGTQIETLEDYVEAISDYASKYSSFKLTHYAAHSKASYFLFQKPSSNAKPIQIFPDFNRKGFQLCPEFLGVPSDSF